MTKVERWLNMPDRDGTGPRQRSPRPKGEKKGRQQGNCWSKSIGEL